MPQPITWKNLPRDAKTVIAVAVLLSGLFGLLFLIGLALTVVAAAGMEELEEAYPTYILVVMLWTLLILVFLRLPWLAWRSGWVQAAKASPSRLALIAFFSLIAVASALFGSTKPPEDDLATWIDQLRLLIPFAIGGLVFLFARSKTNNWVKAYGE